MTTVSAKLTDEQSLHLEFLNVCSVLALHEQYEPGILQGRRVG